MVQARDCFGLGPEPVHHSRRRRLLGQDHFHGDLPLRSVLNRAVHHPHSAARDFFDQVVTESIRSFLRLFRQCGIEQSDGAKTSEGLVVDLRVADGATHMSSGRRR